MRLGEEALFGWFVLSCLKQILFLTIFVLSCIKHISFLYIFVENIVDSSLCLLNDGRITRIPDVSTHRATAIDLSLVTPDLAVNCTWYTEEDCRGSDHLPIITELNENTEDDESEDEDKIPKFQYKHAEWEAYQAFLLSSDINSIINEDINMYCSYFTKTILLAAEQSIPRIKHKKIREQSGNP